MNGLPLVTITLDCETTGVDVTNDRVIELALSVRKGEQPPIIHVFRFNPRCPIPPEATAIHGITDEDVAHCLAFADTVSILRTFLLQADVIAGYNVGFDLAILAQEFFRCGIDDWPKPGTVVLDGMKIWHHQHPRTLANAYRAYAGVIPDSERLHSAEYDIEITDAVIRAQLEQQDIGEIITATNGILLDPAGKVAISETGEAVFTFGKHMGQPVLTQRGYAQWMLDKDFPECTKRVLRGLLQDPDYMSRIITTQTREAEPNGTSVSY